MAFKSIVNKNMCSHYVIMIIQKTNFQSLLTDFNEIIDSITGLVFHDHSFGKDAELCVSSPLCITATLVQSNHRKFLKINSSELSKVLKDRGEKTNFCV